MADREPIRLEPALEDMAVIRTTFETLEYFPGDEPMRRELLEIIEEARIKLADRFARIIGELEEEPTRLPADYDELRDILLELWRKGYTGRSLDAMMKVVFFRQDD